ncbi:MAG: hypothetical protein RBJ76_06185 [Stenomitos frigidus ULC029]
MGTLEQTKTEPTWSEPAGPFLPEAPPVDRAAERWTSTPPFGTCLLP